MSWKNLCQSIYVFLFIYKHLLHSSLACMCMHTFMQKEAPVLSVPDVSCPPLTPLLPAQPVDSVERETRSHPPTGGLCEDGRGPSADEETNKSLTSAEDHQFLSSIAGQLDFVEPSHGHTQAIPTPENSNFKRSCSIPCKRQAPLACPRDPLTPKSVNIITTHPTVGTQTGAVWSIHPCCNIITPFTEAGTTLLTLHGIQFYYIYNSCFILY